MGPYGCSFPGKKERNIFEKNIKDRIKRTSLAEGFFSSVHLKSQRGTAAGTAGSSSQLVSNKRALPDERSAAFYVSQYCPAA